MEVLFYDVLLLVLDLLWVWMCVWVFELEINDDEDDDYEVYDIIDPVDDPILLLLTPFSFWSFDSPEIFKRN